MKNETLGLQSHTMEYAQPLISHVSLQGSSTTSAGVRAHAHTLYTICIARDIASSLHPRLHFGACLRWKFNRGDEDSALSCVSMAARGEILTFSCDQLYEWLLTVLKDEVGDEPIEEVRFQRINGASFLELSDDDLRELFPLIGERKAVQRQINRFKPKVLQSNS